MAFFVTAFCTGEDVPTVRELRNELEARGMPVTISTEAPVDPHYNEDLPTWEQLILAEGNVEFAIVEIERPPAKGGLPSEASDLLEVAEKDEASPERTRVIDHLRQTKFVIIIQFFDYENEDSWDAVASLGNYLIASRGGLVHLEDIGFVERVGDETGFYDI